MVFALYVQEILQTYMVICLLNVRPVLSGVVLLVIHVQQGSNLLDLFVLAAHPLSLDAQHVKLSITIFYLVQLVKMDTTSRLVRLQHHRLYVNSAQM